MVYTRRFPIPDDTQDGDAVRTAIRELGGSSLLPSTFGGGEMERIYAALNELDELDAIRIAAHVSAAATHGVVSAIVGSTDTQTLTNKTLGTGTAFSVPPGGQSNIAHQSIGGAGANTHAQIDSHIESVVATGVIGRIAGGTNNQDIVTKAQLDGTSFSSALPGQSGNAGKFVSTDGTSAFWDDVHFPAATIFAHNNFGGF